MSGLTQRRKGAKDMCEGTGNQVARVIVDACFYIHSRLGPGLLESVYEATPVHAKQLLTYLRLMDKRLGLLINFGAALIKDGIRRVVNGLDEDVHPRDIKPR